MIKKRSVSSAVIIFIISMLIPLPVSADDTRPGRLYLSVGGGWGTYENGNAAYSQNSMRGRVSGGPALAGESRLTLWNDFSAGIGVLYLTGNDNLSPPTQSFPDDYIRDNEPGDPFSTKLTGLYLKAERSFWLKPFILSPTIGISKLWGQVKYPVYVGEAVPPNLPPKEERVFKSGGFGYLLGLKSSIKIYRFVFFESEFGYRFFKLGEPEYEDGTSWPGTNLDFSGSYLSGGLSFRIL